MLKLQRTENGNTNIFGSDDKMRYYIALAKKHVGQRCRWKGMDCIIDSPHVLTFTLGKERFAYRWPEQIKKAMKSGKLEMLEEWEKDLCSRGIVPRYVPVSLDVLRKRASKLRQHLTRRRGREEETGKRTRVRARYRQRPRKDWRRADRKVKRISQGQILGCPW